MAKQFKQVKRVSPPTRRNQLSDSAGIALDGIIVSDDYNRELTGTNRIKIYDQMRKGDGTVRAITQITKLPIRAANWRIEPFSEGRQDKKIAEFISDELFKNQSKTWDETLSENLLFLDYGSMAFELVYEFRLDGDNVLIGLHKLSSITPETIQKWKLPDGEFGIEQFTVNGEFMIPGEKLAVFILDREGQNWEGISMLRSAYKHWYMKDKIYLIDALAHERQGLGVPFGRLPANADEGDIT